MSITVDLSFASILAADLIACVGSDCGCSDCVECPCLHAADPPSFCGNFGTYVSGPCPSLYGDQTFHPAFPVDGDSNPVNCEWNGEIAIGCDRWVLGWDCDHWVLSSSRGTLTCAAGDFDCATGGTFTKVDGDSDLPATVTLTTC